MCMSTSTLSNPRTIILGVALVMWIVLAVVAPWQELGDTRTSAVALCLSVWGWTMWTLVTVALLVPSSISLTTMRIIVPVAVVTSIVSAGPVAVFASIVVTVILFSALFADLMVQGDAYGDERRFCLRTPVPHMAPAVVAWVLLVAPIISGTLGLSAGQWPWAIPLTIAGAVAVAIIPRRLHRLSRRWLVIVPAGVVLHDHVVLGETLMVMRTRIAGLRTTTGPDDAADLTGGVLGTRLSVQLNDSEKVVLSDITARTLGTTVALHVKSFAFAPRRIAAAMSAIKP